MNTSSPESRDRLRRAIINKIGSLQALIRTLKSRQNELAPISRLSSELLTTIFSILSVSAWHEGSGVLEWIRIAHVCRQWREIALNYPRFWSRINFTRLTPVGMAEILFRAKMAPLHLEAYPRKRNMARFEVIGKQLKAHISHTRYLKVSGCDPSTVIKRLVSPTPDLESLTLCHSSSLTGVDYSTIPDNLFEGTAPSLTTLQLQNCDIGWKSPLFKRLRILKIHVLSEEAMPGLNDWLDALNELPQLNELSLRFATPRAPLAHPLISRTVTLPSLTRFKIEDSAKDCALALAHLVFPTLTWLHVHVDSHNREGEDVLLVIPYVVQKVYVLHDMEPLRSILIGDEKNSTEILTWTTPGADVKIHGPPVLDDWSHSACFTFSASARDDDWIHGANAAIFDALLTLLPMNSVSTLTAQKSTGLSKQFWLRHTSRLPLLEQARLVSTAAEEFWKMLAEDIPLDSDGPQLPKLTRLILLDVVMSTTTFHHLRDTLIARVEQGVPLECLDLRACTTRKRDFKLLTEIVVNVRDSGSWSISDLCGLRGGIGYDDFDDRRCAWYGDRDTSEDEDRDSRCEGEDEDETDYD